MYNDLGQKSYVLPPLAADANGSVNAVKLYGYVYKYDERGNCTYKKLPGIDPVYMVYDAADRLILSQDGNQRIRKPMQWTVIKYDVFGRTLYTGVINRDIADSEKNTVHDNVITEEKGTTNQLGNTGYTCNTFINEVIPLAVNYYDDYSFITDTKLNYEPKQGYSSRYIFSEGQGAAGLLTGTRVYELAASSKYSVTAMYYDEKGNMVQSRSTNHLGGYDVLYNDLDFTGNPNKTYTEHTVSATAATPLTELYTYTYDHAGRLKETYYTLNNLPAVLLSAQTYDELGRLNSKVNQNPQLGVFQYEYNIHNWLTKQYDANNTANFSETLFYETTPVRGGKVNFNLTFRFSC